VRSGFERRCASQRLAWDGIVRSRWLTMGRDMALPGIEISEPPVDLSQGLDAQPGAN
jgi:hypothetical protein